MVSRDAPQEPEEVGLVLCAAFGASPCCACTYAHVRPSPDWVYVSGL